MSSPATLANGVRGDGSFSIMVDSESEDVYADDIIVTESPREGWTVASDAEESVAIDLHIDDELRRAGLARDLIRGIQETRKSLGFDISDRISLTWSSHDSEIENHFRRAWCGDRFRGSRHGYRSQRHAG